MVPDHFAKRLREEDERHARLRSDPSTEVLALETLSALVTTASGQALKSASDEMLILELMRRGYHIPLQ